VLLFSLLNIETYALKTVVFCSTNLTMYSISSKRH